MEPLAIALDRENWSLVRMLRSYCYSGYGLQQDAEKDMVHSVRTNAACSRTLCAVNLQGPVSDREYRATLSETNF